MTQSISSFGKLVCSIAVTVVLASVSVASAQELFKSPEDAAGALVSATRDNWPKGVVAVLGRDGLDIVSSGDKIAETDAPEISGRLRRQTSGDKGRRRQGRDDHRHRGFSVSDPAHAQGRGLAIRYGRRPPRDLYRRIGRNELNAIQASLAYVDAQNEYADKDRTGAGGATYAQRIVSRPGKKDGLYWPAAPGDDASPLGELVAHATTEGYAIGDERIPFHGYYFRILTSQGPMAAGGAVDYVAHGKMIGGFALVAYPAEYGNSGVMTFIVNYAGTVFQKDLGERTAKLAERMTSFNPDQTWKKVDVTASPR